MMLNLGPQFVQFVNGYRQVKMQERCQTTRSRCYSRYLKIEIRHRCMLFREQELR